MERDVVGTNDTDLVQILAGELQQTVLSMLDCSNAMVTNQDLVLLERFASLAGEVPHLKSASEKARSLANLLANCQDRFLDDQIYAQILVIVHGLVDAINPNGPPPQSVSRNHLVTPLLPSEETLNSHLAILVDNPVMYAKIQEAAQSADFTTMRLQQLSDIGNFDESTCPAAIIAELKIFQLVPDSLAILSSLRHRLLQPPHLFLMANPDDIAARFDAVRYGATRFISMPPDIGRLMSVIRGVTLKTAKQPFRALLVDDDRMFSEAHQLALNKVGIETLALSDPLRVPFEVLRFQPDVIVSDIFMRGCNGLELLAVLRQDDSLTDTPVIFLTSESDPQRRIEALELGGDDFLSKPVEIPLFVSTVIAHAKRSRRLKRTRKDLHELFKQMQAVKYGICDNLSNDELRGNYEVLLPPNLIPPEDYVISESISAKPASGQSN